MSVLTKIKQAKLVGRGGACFPTGEKWSMVMEAKGKKKYVICNAAEGEPGILKDGFIIDNYPERVVDGIKLALDFLGAKKGIIYINHKYYKKYKKKLLNVIGKSPIDFFKKPINSGYIGGEESSILNAIEGRRIEPRLRPPFPVTSGLWNCLTLINNVETLYNVSLVNSGEFADKRFYTINGDCMHTGVFSYPDNWTIAKILKETKNIVKFPFFVQIGGDASGIVLNNKQLKRQVDGAGSITVYSIAKHKPKDLIKKWLYFFLNETCGQCTPCREGVYRLLEIIKSPEPDWQLFKDLLINLHDSSFCGLGCVVPIPIESFIRNVLVDIPKSKKKLFNSNDIHEVCSCYK